MLKNTLVSLGFYHNSDWYYLSVQFFIDTKKYLILKNEYIQNRIRIYLYFKYKEILFVDIVSNSKVTI